MQLWSEIILVIVNRNRAERSFDFEITRMISDQIALHSVQLPLLIINWLIHSTLLHEIFATCLFRDFEVRIFRDNKI